MCLWLCGARRSKNSLEAEPEIRILMKVICWRDILGRRGEAGWGRTSCGRRWVAARSQKLGSRTCSPACLCPAVMKRWLSSPAHPDLQGACLSPAQRSPIPGEGGDSSMSLARVHGAFGDLDHVESWNSFVSWLPSISAMSLWPKVWY